MKLKLRESVCLSKHGVVAILMLAGVAACGDVESSNEAILVTRQALTFSPVAVADVTITTAGGNQGSIIDCQARNDSSPSGIRRSCLLRWNLTSIPVGSTVNSASITVQVLDPSLQSFALYKVLPPWSETTATWLNRDGVVPWQLGGARGVNDRSTTGTTVMLQNVGSETRLFPVALVQEWINFPTNNHGLSIASASNGDAVIIASREHPTSSFRPRLTVNYTPNGTGGSGGSPGTGGTSPGTGGTSFGGFGP